MNCKPGQMATVVRGLPACNLGRVVKVLALDDSFFVKQFLGVDAWIYEGDLVAPLSGGRADSVADNCLQPFPDDLLADDVTTTKDTPVREAA